MDIKLAYLVNLYRLTRIPQGQCSRNSEAGLLGCSVGPSGTPVPSGPEWVIGSEVPRGVSEYPGRRATDGVLSKRNHSTYWPLLINSNIKSGFVPSHGCFHLVTLSRVLQYRYQLHRKTCTWVTGYSLLNVAKTHQRHPTASFPFSCVFTLHRLDPSVEPLEADPSPSITAGLG